jgi:SAM-dependent methyltransferase
MSAPRVVEVGCYACGETRSRLYAEENGFRLVKCAGCGLLYVNPRPSDEVISQGARTGLHEGAATLERIGSFLPRKVEVYVQILADLFPSRKLEASPWLDVGAGHGEFLEALASFSGGATLAKGLEPGLAKREAARARGLDVEDERFEPEPGSLGGLSLLNVYSHLPDPVQALTRFGGWLRPGGLLLLQTGDSAHLSYRYHHKPFDLPDHLSFANERIVRSILERVGLRVVRTAKYRHGAYKSWQFWTHPRRDMWLLAERR